MAKIRGIKPETFTDSKIVRLSPLARYFFIGMWTLACDNGHIADDEMELKIRLLPADNVDAGDLLDEIEALGMITREHGVITVCNLNKHQKIDRRWFKTCDVPACSVPSKDDDTATTRRDHDGTTTSARSGHERTRTSQDADVDVDVDVDGDSEGDGEVKRRSRDIATRDIADTQFTHFWTSFPSERKRAKADCQKIFTQAVKAGTPAGTIIEAAARYKSDPNREPQFTVNPKTWLREQRWEAGPLPARTGTDRGLAAAQRDMARYADTQPALQVAGDPYPWETTREIGR